ncbi:MAG: FAD-dependent oxidoreductase [Synergistaceae bacterium]|nr:FAD-dependent oxidoreductase [Synergistaceae bacterium]
MHKRLLALFVLLLTATSSYAYDIIIAGGGMSGISAAIQATRMGASVLVAEPTGLLGGQSTAAGVSTMDDMSRIKENGLYREFIDRVREHYEGMRKSIATSYWKENGKAFEPLAGHKILQDMAASADILFHAEVVGVSRDESGRTVTLKTSDGTKSFTCRLLIDATEYGDVIPMAGLRYRSGNSLSPDMNPNSMIQDITWTAVIRSYPQGIPETLRPKSPLPGYERARKNYLAYVSRNMFGAGDKSPFKLPAEFSAHNAYRAIPDSYTPGSYTGARRDWKRITKTGVNWGNDYPGSYGWEEKYGLPIAYLEDVKFREDINREALIKTLHFIWYIQNELGELWSVDENEYNELPECARDLPEEWQNIARHLPPVPYVRECRRILGDYTFNAKAIYDNSMSYRDGRKNQELPDAIAIGGYILDLHAGDDDDDFEHDLGEWQASIRTYEPAGAFQVPMRIFIPASDDTFLAAEKNLSMSRLASGALRLQPVCMMTGQAVGALAALSLKWNVKPREVHALHVQKVLADSGVRLSLAEYSDVQEGDKYYSAVQIATLYNLIEPEKFPVYPKQRISSPSKNRIIPGRFGVNRKMTRRDMNRLLSRAESVMKGKLTLPAMKEGTTRGEAVRLVIEAMDGMRPSLPDTEAAEHGVDELITSPDTKNPE